MTVYSGAHAVKTTACREEDFPAFKAKVVGSLRGDALACAVETGVTKLVERDGLELLTVTWIARSTFVILCWEPI